MIIVTLEVYITPTRSILPLVVLLIIRYCFELRGRFAVSFRHCFENFDFTSKFESGSPSHFDPVSTFIHSRYCFELRRRFAVSFRHSFENFDFTSKIAFVSTSQFELITKFTNMKYPHDGEELSSS